MSRSKSKIAVTLLGALAFGANAQAMNQGVKDVKSEQTIEAVEGARNQPKKINWKKIAKIGGFSIAGLAVLETIHSIVGGVTDSKFGSFSIGRAIRNRIRNNGQHNEEKNDENLNAVLEKFRKGAENCSDLFKNSEEVIRNTYKKILNKNYQLNVKGNIDKKIANIVLDFIAGKKITEGNTEITASGQNSFILRINFKNKVYNVFLITCFVGNKTKLENILENIVVVFGNNKIITFR